MGCTIILVVPRHYGRYRNTNGSLGRPDGFVLASSFALFPRPTDRPTDRPPRDTNHDGRRGGCFARSTSMGDTYA